YINRNLRRIISKIAKLRKLAIKCIVSKKAALQHSRRPAGRHSADHLWEAKCCCRRRGGKVSWPGALLLRRKQTLVTLLLKVVVGSQRLGEAVLAHQHKTDGVTK